MSKNKFLWWGYIHTQTNEIQVKRYFGEKDIDEAYESPFCGCINGPFEADDRDEAILIMNESK